MDISQKGIDFIVSFEGKKTLLPDGNYQSYLDDLADPPVWTIYCGLTHSVGKRTVWSKEECERHFAEELEKYEDAIERLVKVKLNQNQFDALVSFVYNCGIGALERSTLLKLLNKGDYGSVPTQLNRWVKAGGITYRGLVRRRAAEGAMFMLPMPQDVELHPDDYFEIEDGQPVVPTPPLIVVPDPDNEPMPQRVEPVNGSMKQAAKESWTIKSALAGIAATIYQIWTWTMNTVSEAGTQVVDIKKTTSGFDALLTWMGISMPVFIAIATLGALVAVIARRLMAAREMKTG